ncbi:hypothetical protein ASG52_24490 [Methylobacterium sp. Leaf456]|uniref:YheC/YheD family protein n=1 Tax=Methylobacterium sp. Leaf456 TaxID=1736382 RepID=UPI0006FDCF61|nr:YheC/YheD family protein [Methylobacterium sp. Leaf456]KQT56082.1 hypothetical protein ASG52_24490 [Methylobacterium sp. Leaf456]
MIGLLVFAKAPREHLPPLRLRAMIAEAVLQGARLALFSAADCDPDGGTVTAETWSQAGWTRSPMPLPDVVLIVSNPRHAQHRRIERWIRGRTAFVRDFGPDKLTLPALLAATPLARHVIPQRRIEPEAPAAQIADWLRTHGDCVVKAVSGKRGHGIFRIHAGAAGRWSVRKDDAETHFLDATAAAAAVGRRIAGRLGYRAYIVQTYVPSVSPDGRAADIRVHVQRDGGGRWGVTRGYVRLGEAGQAVSNVSRGGYQGPLEGFLGTRQVRPAAELLAEIETLALDVATTIEATFGRTLSELGVDIALDRQDHLWLIEANTHPQSSLHEHDRAVRTIAYALHRATQPPPDDRAIEEIDEAMDDTDA